MRVPAATLMTLLLVVWIPGCVDYKSNRCTSVSDCTGVTWSSESCDAEDGHWECLDGRCQPACDQNHCVLAADCEGKPWPVESDCPEPDGRWACLLDDSLPLTEVAPLDNEFDDFRQGGQTPVDDEAGLYAQINGAAEALAQAGWLQSLFVVYVDATETGLVFTLALHDLGTTENARAYYLGVLTDGHTELWDEDDTAAARLEVPDIYLQIDMYLAKFFIRLTIEGTGASAERVMVDFALYFRDQALQRICQPQCDP